MIQEPGDLPNLKIKIFGGKREEVIMLRKCTKSISSIIAVMAVTFMNVPYAAATNVQIDKNYGSQTVKSINVNKNYKSLMDLMKGNEKIETAYNDTFISKIEGVGGDADSAWMFYLNGVSSLIGANDLKPKNSDDIVFDYHSWKTGFNFNSIVASYPKPFTDTNAKSKNVVGYTKSCKAEAQLLAKFLKNAGVKNIVIKSADNVSDNDANIIVGVNSEILKNKYINSKVSNVNYGMYAKINLKDIQVPYSDNKTFKKFINAGMVYSISLPKKDSIPTWIVSATDKKSLDNTIKLFNKKENFKGKFDIVYTNNKVYGIPLNK